MTLTLAHARAGPAGAQATTLRPSALWLCQSTSLCRRVSRDPLAPARAFSAVDTPHTLLHAWCTSRPAMSAPRSGCGRHSHGALPSPSQASTRSRPPVKRRRAARDERPAVMLRALAPRHQPAIVSPSPAPRAPRGGQARGGAQARRRGPPTTPPDRHAAQLTWLTASRTISKSSMLLPGARPPRSTASRTLSASLKTASSSW